MATTKKYVSLEKLGLYDQKIKSLIDTKDTTTLDAAKTYADGLASNYDATGAAATAKTEAIEAAKTETTKQVKALADGQVATNKADIAAIKDGEAIDSFADVETALAGKQAVGDYATKTEAQGYANAKDTAIQAAQTAAEAAQADATANATAITNINNETTGILAQAKKYAADEDVKVQANINALSDKVGTVPDGSTVMGIITNIQENAYDDTAITQKIDGIGGKVTTLIGTDADKSVRTIANEELVKQLIPENADQSLDTLQEIAQWIQDHPGDASAMNEAITALQNKVDTGDKNVSAYVADAIAALKIGDYAKAADLTALAGRVTALEGKFGEGEGSVASQISTAKQEAIDAAAADATTKANTAETNAKTHANGLNTAMNTRVEALEAIDHDHANKTELDKIADGDKAKWDAAYTHSQTAHAPADAQANIIESVKVNGTALKITDKAVDVTVPTKVSELTNDSNYLVAGDIANKADKATTLAGYGITNAYTTAQTDSAIATAIADFVECSEEDITSLFA